MKNNVSACWTQILPLAYALTYCVFTDVFYSLGMVEHSPPSHTPILVTVKLIPNIRAKNPSHYSTQHWLTGYCVSTDCVRLTESHHGLVGHVGRDIYKCPYTGGQPCWCVSVPNNPVVRHSRQKYAVANEPALRKLLILLTAVELWCLLGEPNPLHPHH